MIPIEIPRRQRQCIRGQEPFVQGMPYVSRLTLIKEGEYTRDDFCLACWEKESDKGYISWKGEVPRKTAVEKKTDRLEKGLEILKQNLESDAAIDHKEAFLLALYLQRKKWLLARGEFRRKGQEKLLFEVAHTEEMIEVPKIALTPADSVLQEGIAKKLCL